MNHPLVLAGRRWWMPVLATLSACLLVLVFLRIDSQSHAGPSFSHKPLTAQKPSNVLPPSPSRVSHVSSGVPTNSKPKGSVHVPLVVPTNVTTNVSSSAAPSHHSSDAGLPTLNSSAYVSVVRSEHADGWPHRVFKSSPWMPPNMSVSVTNAGLADGYLFVTPKPRSGKGGIEMSAPYVLTSDNELVYAYNATRGTSGFRVQQLAGKPRLTFWQGETTIGRGYGRVVMLDRHYNESVVDLDADIRWDLRDGRKAPGLVDYHENILTPQGTLLVTAYNITTADLRPFGGPEHGHVVDSHFYEIDPATSRVLFRWSALDHVGLGDSHMPVKSYMGDGTKGKGWDFFHINSIQKLGDDYLINSRHTWACYLVSGKDGRVLWTLSGSGEGGSFGPVPVNGTFRWAHDARAHNISDAGMAVSLFDNHNMEQDNGTMPTRGLVLGVGLPPDAEKPPVVLRDVRAAPDFYSGSQGSYDAALPNGNQLLCYGPSPVVREFGPGGDLLWEGRLGLDDKVQSYRAFKAEWHATPLAWDPSLVVEAAGTTGGRQLLEAYVSWNGATDVEGWTVHVGPSERELRKVGRAAKRGFETVIEVAASKSSCVQVAALQGGKEVRRSNVVCLA
ncbi:hypothetical protein DCS_03180 [Drechmeria coniospora]|uniref:Arylsulfotransferase n=1 Tax=Drechmeria coniospora TaxID=98403 RepID=A0A151GY66_DRECN|nr:hypothetical protein DCS_03180 [Drechmeria coniospora]KYK62035.1 hypothetical protein DCS_03180 [Drechmeria coniospora]